MPTAADDLLYFGSGDMIGLGKFADLLSLSMIDTINLLSLYRCQPCPLVNEHGTSASLFSLAGNPENVKYATLSHILDVWVRGWSWKI